jgi:putative peptidoglycan lipid II flippase
MSTTEGLSPSSSPAPAPDERAASRLAGNSLTVAAWTAVSRVTGFLRVMVVAAVLGPTYLGNVYQATNTLPNMTFAVFLGSLFVTLLVPPLVRGVDACDRRATERLAGSFLGAVVLAFGALAALIVVAGPLVLRLLSVGVQDAAVAAAQRRDGWLLLAMFMPQLMLYATAATGEAVMNAHGRFALAAAAPALENLGIIATMAATAIVHGTGAELAAGHSDKLWLLGLGTTGAVGLHAAAQWWGARRVGVCLVPRMGWRDPEVRRTLRRAVPSLGYSALHAVQGLGALVVANRVPGGVVAHALAYNFYSLPWALGAKPVAVALLPRLARLFQAGQAAAFRDELVRGVGLVAFLTVPAAVAYAVLAEPLARAVSFGDMASTAGVTLVAVSLAALAPGIVGDGGMLVATNAAYAREDTRSPFDAMAVRTLVTLAGFAAAFAVPAGPVVLVALGLTVSAADVAGGLHLARRVAVGLPRRGERLGPAALRALAGSLAMAGPAWLVATHLPALVAWPWADQLGVLAAAATGLAVFVVVQRLWRSPELASLLGGLRELQPQRGRTP